MQGRSRQLATWGLATLVGLCGCIIILTIIGRNAPRTADELVRTSQVVAPSLTSTPVPAEVVVPTEAIAPTASPEVTPSPDVTRTTIPTLPPVASSTPALVSADNSEARYIALAQTGVLVPSIRSSFNLPEGTWSANVINVGDGPEVEITLPINPALSNEDVVRLGKLKLAHVIKALFEGDAKLVRITAMGTLPDGADGSELPVLRIFILRPEFDRWDGTAENLGEWNVAPRYR